MAVKLDPEGNETFALHGLVTFRERSVLEIGCGDGRLTWRYAEKASAVTAIDPDGKAIAAAHASIPEGLANRVKFIESSIEDFAASYTGRKFDAAIFSWSL